MVVLTVGVTVRLYLVQMRAIKKREVRYRFFRVYEGEAPDYLQQAREHYKNMFEFPVLFYLLCIFLILKDSVDFWDIGLAWSFVILRYIHSYIRMTSNYVPGRFAAFAGSFFALILGWVKFLVGLT